MRRLQRDRNGDFIDLTLDCYVSAKRARQLELNDEAILFTRYTGEQAKICAECKRMISVTVENGGFEKYDYYSKVCLSCIKKDAQNRHNEAKPHKCPRCGEARTFNYFACGKCLDYLENNGDNPVTADENRKITEKIEELGGGYEKF